MRLWAGVGMVVLGCAGCAHIPDRVSVEVDGTRVEVERPCSSPPVPGSSSDERE